MRNIDEHTITAAMLQRLEGCSDARLKEVLSALVRHLHGFAREVDLKGDEWFKAIEFLTACGKACDEKRQEFWPIIKTGRTHLQDATPIRLGQEFLGYVGQMDRALQRLETASQELREVALGGNAVGTGINMHPEFPGRVCEIINARTGLGIHETSNHFQAQSTIDNLVAASGAVRTVFGEP